MVDLWIINQFKDNKSGTTYASLTKLNEHPRVLIKFLCKFHEIPVIGYLYMTQFVYLKQFMGNNVLRTGEVLTKCKSSNMF